jgi:hypothetical protein
MHQGHFNQSLSPKGDLPCRHRKYQGTTWKKIDRILLGLLGSIYPIRWKAFDDGQVRTEPRNRNPFAWIHRNHEEIEEEMMPIFLWVAPCWRRAIQQVSQPEKVIPVIGQKLLIQPASWRLGCSPAETFQPNEKRSSTHHYQLEEREKRQQPKRADSLHCLHYSSPIMIPSPLIPSKSWPSEVRVQLIVEWGPWKDHHAEKPSLHPTRNSQVSQAEFLDQTEIHSSTSQFNTTQTTESWELVNIAPQVIMTRDVFKLESSLHIAYCAFIAPRNRSIWWSECPVPRRQETAIRTHLYSGLSDASEEDDLIRICFFVIPKQPRSEFPRSNTTVSLAAF